MEESRLHTSFHELIQELFHRLYQHVRHRKSSTPHVCQDTIEVEARFIRFVGGVDEIFIDTYISSQFLKKWRGECHSVGGFCAYIKDLNAEGGVSMHERYFRHRKTMSITLKYPQVSCPRIKIREDSIWSSSLT